VLDSDGDSPAPPAKSRGDCVEAADVDGNGNLDFTGDVTWEAQFGLIGTPGTPTGICH
jgi:hypothetical protein